MKVKIKKTEFHFYNDDWYGVFIETKHGKFNHEFYNLKTFYWFYLNLLVALEEFGNPDFTGDYYDLENIEIKFSEDKKIVYISNGAGRVNFAKFEEFLHVVNKIDAYISGI